MKAISSAFGAIPEQKRKFIFLSLIVGAAGMLWSTNDLMHQNPDHPLFAPENLVMSSGFDNHGDPYAVSKPKPLPYAKIWSSPVTRLSVVFLIALVIGSLIRNLMGGVMALFSLLAVIGIVVGREQVLELFKGHQSSGFVETARDWFGAHGEAAKTFLAQSFPTTIAAAVGGLIGLSK